MSRWFPALLLLPVAIAAAQDAKPPAEGQQQQLKKDRGQPQGEKEEVPPEEDKSMAPTEYAFNPLQAEKEIRVGNYYLHKGKYRAAAGRYREATQWNQSSSEAWLKLAEAEEKAKNRSAAKLAYTKYLEISPDAKNAEEIRKKLEKLK